MSQVLSKSLFLPIAGLLCSSVNLSGQQSLGVLSGTITDATGAAVTNSTITLTSDQTGAVRNVTASRNGSYSFQALPIGPTAYPSRRPASTRRRSFTCPCRPTVRPPSRSS